MADNHLVVKIGDHSFEADWPVGDNQEGVATAFEAWLSAIARWQVADPLAKQRQLMADANDGLVNVQVTQLADLLREALQIFSDTDGEGFEMPEAIAWKERVKCVL